MNLGFRVAIITAFIFLCGTVFAFSVRGFSGNPDIATLNSRAWITDGPLELSPERGRFALLYSVVEDRSLIFSLPVARLATPDLGMNGAGQYVSLFAPGVSFIAIPGYLLGKMLGASQVGAYLVISLFALVNMLLIRSLALRLGAGYFASLLSALVFGFATPAFAYGVNLYQHHVSVFILLASLYLLIRFRHPLSFALVWFFCAASVVMIDNPNLFLMLPIGLFALVKLWGILREESFHKGASLRDAFRSSRYIAGFLTVLLPLAFFFWYNDQAYGSPLQLPGTLIGVDEIGADGKPVRENTYEKEVLTDAQKEAKKSGESKEKTALGFFETRNLYEGFWIHFLSPDRGIIYFTPVILLGVFGLFRLYRTHVTVAALLIAVIGMNVLTYSMWGDPQGGWAFGSRYLIPTYALLAVAVAFGFDPGRFRKYFVILFIPLFVYSAWVNSLGAVTSSVNPPKVEVLALEKQTRHEQKYTFLRNWEYLHEKYEKVGSKSFLYQAGLKKYLSAVEYQSFVFGLILLLGVLVGVGFWYENPSWRSRSERTEDARKHTV